ncbi:MAG: TOBE domain-containing protein, partial [Clostridia bacterium]
TKRVAEFFGCVNFIHGVQKGKTIDTKYGVLDLPKLKTEEDREVYLIVRNECFEVSDEKGSFKAKIKSRIFMGTSVRYIIEANGEVLHMTLESTTTYKEGDEISLKFIVEKLWAVPFDDKL